MTENALGERIQRARNDKQMSLRELEAVVGVSNAHLSQLETGKIAKPSMALLYAVASALDLDFAELMRLAGHVSSLSDGQTLTLATPTPDSVGAALYNVVDLTPDELEELRRFADLLRRRRKRVT